MPKYASRLSNLQAHFFAEPKELPEPVEVHLNPGELPHDLIGSLQPVDAPELRDAMRMAIAQDIREGAGRKVMAQWRAILMSTVVKFKVVDDSNKVQQVFQTVVQRREDIGVRQENQGEGVRDPGVQEAIGRDKPPDEQDCRGRALREDQVCAAVGACDKLIHRGG